MRYPMRLKNFLWLLLFFSFLEAKTSPLVIKAVGDISPGNLYPNNRLHPGGIEALFKEVLPLLRDKDILFGNYESTLTNYTKTPKDTRRKYVFAFRTPPYYARGLRRIGFDVLSIANNHSLDFGWRGFQDTIYHLKKVGILPVSKKGEILYQNVRGRRIAWIGFSYLPYHNSILRPKEVKKLIQKANKEADLVFVSCHAGKEGSDALHTKNQYEYYLGRNRGNLVYFSHLAIDLGADLVLCHGPHVVRALELYKGRLIAYSLGNFVGYRTLSTYGNKGYSLILEVHLDPIDGSFLRGKIHPILLRPHGIPRLDPKKRAISLIRRLTKEDFPSTPLVISPTGEISLVYHAQRD